MNGFKLLYDDNLDNAAWADESSDFDDDPKIVYGEPVGESYGDGAWVRMSDEGRQDTLLFDHLPNCVNFLIVSDRFKQFLAEHVPAAHVEFLRCALRDHAGKPVPEQYWNVNLLDPVDCVNREKSVIQMSQLDPDLFFYPKKVVYDFDKIPDDRVLFKVKGFLSHFFIRESLARLIDEAGITNVRWAELDDIDKNGGL